MKKILFIIILSLPFIVLSQTPVPGGSVSGTWDLSGSPYMVNGEIYIEEMATLQIEAGVEVRFTGWYKFIINGSLMAEGTETANILFTADNSNDHWHGLRFVESNKTSVLDYCIVEYGETVLTTGMGVFPENAGGGILVSMCPDASISIKNSIIRNNEAFDGGGILCNESSITVENCEISSNSAVSNGGGMNIIFNSSLIMTNSIIANNSAENEGGGLICLIQGSLELINNTFIHNSCQNNGGGICLYAPISFNIKQNIIAHNSAEEGGGIFLKDTHILGSLSDNTIVYNVATIDGGGVYCSGNITHAFESDIIYFNDVNGINNQMYFSYNSIPIISYCNIQDSTAGFSGSGAAQISLTDCVYGNPLFSDPMNDDFSLTWLNYPEPDNTMSPCIDAGCEGPFPEPDGTDNDIGAEYFFQQLDVPEAIPPISYSQTSFMAFWTEAYGALWYELDVAEDAFFNTLVYDSIIVNGTDYLVEGLEFNTEYYYRVRSANTALLSGNSNTVENDIIIRTLENSLSEPLIYSARGKLKVEISDEYLNAVDLQIYDLSGRLIQVHRLQPGSNTINLNLSNQVIIIKVLIEGRAYHQKLFIP